tara:strand:- start:354 stop:527 length:174 start_codon:yes stop_codon:yes gene_type:complete
MSEQTIAEGREIILCSLIEQLEEGRTPLSAVEIARLRAGLTDALVREILVEIACWND